MDEDIWTALREATARLDAAHVDAPATTARLLLAHVLDRPKEWLIAHGDVKLDATAQQRFRSLLQRVIAHEPLAYVLGHREFYGLDLIVDRRVLIPRPETEMLVELALNELRIENEELRKSAGPDFSILNSQFSILDVGTGSGAIPIAIATHAPDVRILATDISTDALAVARLNAERHGVADRITLLQADLLDGIVALPPIITANLPYVTREEIEGLPPEIQAHEPRIALDGGEDGLALVRRLLEQIAARAETHDHASLLRAAFLEIGASQGPAALAAAQAILPHAHAEIKKDLAGLDRVLAIHFHG
ncbi:MAG: peptide chain release factor N(5)-glutamine methyltransferase [Anaerolineae bacterium]|nr:peptide chain release factor N(5)-glutamine methyltransferase [Candidatus Roseilinea sp.]MDW8450371.1 peptide chain release factor N(5)-glutamine methyltransferase [Anaerolineae bacterium]